MVLVDSTCQACFYYGDLFVLYRTPVYRQIYRVEINNTELGHYLARFAWRLRCHSRCIHALCRAVKLFVYTWNSCEILISTFRSIMFMSWISGILDS